MKGRRTPRSRSTRGGSRSFFLALAAITMVAAAGLFLFDSLLRSGGGGDAQDEILAPIKTEGPGTHDVDSSGGADVHFATTAVDFGVVPLNTEAGYAFSFANVGDERLEIEDVKVSVLEGC